MKEKQYLKLNIQLKGVDEERKSLRAVFSTPDVDRHGDVVVQNWDLNNYNQNPVILNSHSYHDATEVIGKAENVGLVNGKLEGDIIFAVDENPKAKIIFDLYKGKFLSAFSVGFIPLDFNERGEISKAELLEVSAVAVPANAMALAKAKGIEVEDAGLEIEEKSEEEEPEEQLEEVETKDVEEEAEVKSPKCRLDGETTEDCMSRKIPEIIAEGNDQEQAVAIAASMCETACGTTEAQEEEAISEKNVSRIKGAVDELKSTIDEVTEPKAVRQRSKAERMRGIAKHLGERKGRNSATEADRAKTKRAIAKTVRLLLKIKKEI